MIGKFDFSQITEFGNQLKGLEQEWQVFIQDTLKEVAIRLYTKTVQRTPVDTGTLRRAWQIEAMKPVAGGYEVVISNNVEYAVYVEFGHRTRNHKGWVEGRFMLTISEDELAQELPGILENRLSQFLQKHGLR